MRAFLLLLLSALTAFGHSTNRVPNSSFEAGTGRGWISYNTGYNPIEGNINFVSDHLTNNVGAPHGAHAYKLFSGAPFASRGFWLTNGTYCLSGYAKTDDGTTIGGLDGWVSRSLDEEINVAQVVIANVSPTWTRFQTNYVVTSNGFYCVRFGNGHPTTTVLIDAIQLELGTEPTTYAPQSNLEMGIVMGGTYSMFFAGDVAPSFGLKFRNEGALSNAHAWVQVFDAWNSNVLSTNFLFTLPASTNTNTTVLLPARTGWFRIVTRLPDIMDSYDEAKTIVYPYASNTVAHGTNDWLGGHPHTSAFHAKRELLAGRRLGRTLSPGSRNTRWWSTQPPSGGQQTHIEDTRGNMIYEPGLSYSNWTEQGMIGLGCLTPQDTQWPPWAVMSNAVGQTYHTNELFPYVGMWDGMAWSNYCFWTTLTNKLTLRFVEIGPNEPLQTGPFGDDIYPYTNGTAMPVNVRVATNYAKVLKFGIDGVTNADPTVKIIGIAGAYGAGDWAWEVWTNLSPNIQSWIYAVSNHQYANDQAENPNDPFYIGFSEPQFNVPMGWMDRFKGIRPVWNTESSTYGIDYMHGLNAAPFHYEMHTNYEASGISEAFRSESGNRQLNGSIRAVSTVLRHLGFGYAKYFWYDSRFFWGDAFGIPSQAGISYPADYLQVDRPELVAISVATHFISAPGLGAISNLTSGTSFAMEMYMFNGAANGPWAGKAVVAGWSADRGNRTLTLTNGHFAVFDFMGNQSQTNSTTVKLTRVPQYFVSTVLSVAQLSNTFRVATATIDPDVIAPQLSFDIAPTGAYNGDPNPQLFKWTAIDDIAAAWVKVSHPDFYQLSSRTNVVYKWKLDGGTYTPYSQSNHVWIPNLAAGDHTFYVTTSDKTGNAQEYSYSFLGPPPPPAPPVLLNVSGTVNVGTIVVP